MTAQPNVEVHIEELVLHGFEGRDQHYIAAAVQQELTRLFVAQRVPASLRQSSEVTRVNAGAVHLTHAARPENTGAQVARAIYGGLRS